MNHARERQRFYRGVRGQWRAQERGCWWVLSDAGRAKAGFLGLEGGRDFFGICGAGCGEMVAVVRALGGTAGAGGVCGGRGARWRRVVAVAEKVDSGYPPGTSTCKILEKRTSVGKILKAGYVDNRFGKPVLRVSPLTQSPSLHATSD